MQIPPEPSLQPLRAEAPGLSHQGWGGGGGPGHRIQAREAGEASWQQEAKGGQRKEKDLKADLSIPRALTEARPLAPVIAWDPGGGAHLHNITLSRGASPARLDLGPG